MNSLKSILVRYSALKTKGLKSGEYNEVVKALKSVGINAIGSDKKLRNFQDVVDELGNKWDSLSKKSQAYVATAKARNKTGFRGCYRFDFV